MVQEQELPIEVVWATGTQTVGLPSGQTIVVEHGSHWPADDPVVQYRPGLFTRDSRYGMQYSQAKEEYDPDQHPPLPTLAEEAFAFADDGAEQATAAPGERRSVRRPRA